MRALLCKQQSGVTSGTVTWLLLCSQAQNNDPSESIAVTELFFFFSFTDGMRSGWGEEAQHELSLLRAFLFSKYLRGNFQPGVWALNHMRLITTDEIHAAWPLLFYLPFNLASFPIMELLTVVF